MTAGKVCKQLHAHVSDRVLCCEVMLCGCGVHGTVQLLSRGHAIRSLSATAVARPSSEGVSLDLKLVAENPELVMAHLTARGASQDVLDSITQLGELHQRRKELIRVGDGASPRVPFVGWGGVVRFHAGSCIMCPCTRRPGGS